MEISSQNLIPKDIYKLLSGLIIPRPIALVSTKSTDGINNLAPFSFFNAVSSDPPVIMLSIGSRNGQKKDTVRNIERHPQFVVNLVNEKIVQQMHDASADFLPGISEFEEVGLTPVPAKSIDCMAVKDSPVHFECSLERIVPIGANYMVFGRIEYFRIDDHVLLGDYQINMDDYKPVARLAQDRYGIIKDQFVLEKHYDPSKIL